MGDPACKLSLMKNDTTVYPGLTLVRILAQESQRSNTTSSVSHCLAPLSTSRRWPRGTIESLQATTALEPETLFRFVTVGFKFDVSRWAANIDSFLSLKIFLRVGTEFDPLLGVAMKNQLIKAIRNLEILWSIVFSPIWQDCMKRIRIDLLSGRSSFGVWEADVLRWALERQLAQFCHAVRLNTSSTVLTPPEVLDSFNVIVVESFLSLLDRNDDFDIRQDFKQFSSSVAAYSSSPKKRPTTVVLTTNPHSLENNGGIGTSFTMDVANASGSSPPLKKSTKKKKSKSERTTTTPATTGTPTKAPSNYVPYPCALHICNSLQVIDIRTNTAIICTVRSPHTACRNLHDKLSPLDISKADFKIYLEKCRLKSFKVFPKAWYDSAVINLDKRP